MSGSTAADLTDAKFNFVDLRQWQFLDGKDHIATLTRTDFRGAVLYLHTIQIDGDRFLDLGQAVLSGAVFADAPEQWPAATIDPVKAGIVFRQSRQALADLSRLQPRNADLRSFDLFNSISPGSISAARIFAARGWSRPTSAAPISRARSSRARAGTIR